MKKHQPIQINIPNPCTEDWDKMIPFELGRFCNSCQKKVIDFTTLTDKQLYEYVTQHADKHFCGRFLNTQLNRPITIPVQPHSRLYHYFVGLGMTLLFSAVAVNNLYARVPYTYEMPFDKNDVQNIGAVGGTILDNKKEPIIGACITIMQGDEIKGGTTTDEEGSYIVKPLEPGKYDVFVVYPNYKKMIVTAVLVTPDRTTKVNVQMQLMEADKQTVTDEYKVSAIGIDERKVITAEEIEKLPIRTTGGGIVYQSNNKCISLGGARDDSTPYFVDGIRVVGGRGINLVQGGADYLPQYEHGISPQYSGFEKEEEKPTYPIPPIRIFEPNKARR